MKRRSPKTYAVILQAAAVFLMLGGTLVPASAAADEIRALRLFSFVSKVSAAGEPSNATPSHSCDSGSGNRFESNTEQRDEPAVPGTATFSESCEATFTTDGGQSATASGDLALYFTEAGNGDQLFSMTTRAAGEFTRSGDLTLEAAGTSLWWRTFEVEEELPFRLTGATEGEIGGDNASVDVQLRVEDFETGAQLFTFGAEFSDDYKEEFDETLELPPGRYRFLVSVDPRTPRRVTEPDLGHTGTATYRVDLTLSACDIIGTEGADTLTGTAEGEVICGLGGNDVIEGGGGDDVLLGGEGDDMLRGGGGGDNAQGGAGDDKINGGGGDDELDGGAGEDELDGGSGADVIVGGADGDTIDGGGARDLLSGNGGDDLIEGGGGSDEIAGDGGDDAIVGGDGDDSLHGNRGDDVIDGGAGRDKLRGQAGSDTLRGGAKKDVLIGGRRKDRLRGGGGNDVLRAKDGVRDVVNGGPGARDRAQVDENKDTVSGVEFLL